MRGDGSVRDTGGTGSHKDLNLRVVFLHDSSQTIFHIQANLMIRQSQTVVTVNRALDPAGPGKRLVRPQKYSLNF